MSPCAASEEDEIEDGTAVEVGDEKEEEGAEVEGEGEGEGEGAGGSSPHPSRRPQRIM
jgi:hypothetical protein